MDTRLNYIAALFLLALLPHVALAENTIPDHWRVYTPEHLVLNPGYQMYWVESTRQFLLRAPDAEFPRPLTTQTVDIASDAFATIRTKEQAKELCEMLLNGALVDSADVYKKLLKVHQAEGLKQLVDDDALAFDQVAKQTEAGFQIEYTAFHLPLKMGAESIVARYVFVVDKDANVKISSTAYLEGILLNWQTRSLDTEEARVREGKALGRVVKFVDDCLAQCPTKLPKAREAEKEESAQ